MFNALAVVSVTDRLDAAAPPFAPLPLSLDPPAPATAVCVKVNAPEVEPPIALFIVELAPDPPEEPVPPPPPVCVADVVTGEPMVDAP